MPIQNSYFDSLLAMTALCNDAELQALIDKCQNLIANRERIKRDELQQELMENLYKAIEDILHNDFALTIEIEPYEDEDTDVYFNPEDIYSVKMKDMK